MYNDLRERFYCAMGHPEQVHDERLTSIFCKAKITYL